MADNPAPNPPGTDDVAALGTSGISGAGRLVLEPVADSFSAPSTTFTTPIQGLSGLVIGKGGNTAGLNLTGTVNVAGPISVFAGDLNIQTPLSSTATGDVLLKSSGTLTIAPGQQISASAGDITLVANRFVNQAGSGALATTGNHLWQLWSTNADPFDTSIGDVTGGLVAGFKQYNASHGNTTPLGTGHGLFYSLAPVLSLGLNGAVEIGRAHV